MDWLKRLFGTKAVNHTLDWKMQPFVSEDFLVDSLENYTDPHLNMILSFVREIVLKRLRDHVYIGGGFACHVAGVTNDHGDIDIFCTGNTFPEMHDHILNNQGGKLNFRILNSDKDTVFKFEYEGFKFDLVDTSVPFGGGIQDLFKLFDFNWSMVAIDLAKDEIVCHKDALSTIPQVNSSRIDERIEVTMKRLEKYKDRLVKEPNMSAYDCLILGLQMRQQAMPFTDKILDLGY